MSELIETPLIEVVRGGKGSGHHGHGGLKGVHGGSTPSGGGDIIQQIIDTVEEINQALDKRDLLRVKKLTAHLGKLEKLLDESGDFEDQENLDISESKTFAYDNASRSEKIDMLVDAAGIYGRENWDEFISGVHRGAEGGIWITPDGKEAIFSDDHEQTASRLFNEVDASDEIGKVKGKDLYLYTSEMTSLGFVRAWVALDGIFIEFDKDGIRPSAKRAIRDWIFAHDPNFVQWDSFINGELVGSGKGAESLGDELGIDIEFRSMIRRGGKGSGHHGHKGRPGLQGGSLPNKTEDVHSRANWLNYLADQLRGAKRPEIKDGSDRLWKRYEEFGLEKLRHGDPLLRSDAAYDFLRSRMENVKSVEWRKAPEFKDGYVSPSGHVIEDREGNLLLAVMYSEGSMIRLPGLWASSPGSGLGTKFMNAAKELAEVFGASFSVDIVANHAFFGRFKWLEGKPGDISYVYTPDMEKQAKYDHTLKLYLRAISDSEI